MFTLYKGAYQSAPRAPKFTGLSTDDKPITSLANGAIFECSDTGDIYRWDKENQQWLLSIGG